MDSGQLILFQADINQQQTIDRIFILLQNRAKGLESDNVEKLESLAY
ncbi:hypothetical protein [Synechococcus sp. PCC 6312]|nr:hypothetical protein [Synechococcus sp. PCC 6312]